MIRVVPDTNIIISAIFWKGKPYGVVRRGLEGEYSLVTSKEVLAEVVDRLKKKFNFPESDILLYIDIIFTYFYIVRKPSKFDAVRHKSDNKILETAFDGKADYIVTGDSDLLELKEFKGIKILTAEEFLSRRT